MRFVTFNTLHGRRPRSRVDLDAFADAVAGLEADVVGLQEVDKGMIRTRWADMAAKAGRRASMRHAFGPSFRRWDLGLYGNALLSRTPLSAAETVRLTRAGSEERRTALVANIDAGADRWAVATTHLALDKRSSCDQLEQLLAMMASRPLPSVVMGDFNRKPDDVIPVAEALGWRVVETGPTYPSWGPEIRIDYVLVRGARTVATEVRRLAVSDHCAVIVDLISE